MVECFVPECSHDSGTSSCEFFEFPSYTERATKKLWVEKIRNPDRPTVSSRVCSCHFVERLKLNPPTLFPWNNEKFALYEDPVLAERERDDLSQALVCALEEKISELEQEFLEIRMRDDRNTQYIETLNKALQEKENEAKLYKVRIQSLVRHIRALNMWNPKYQQIENKQHCGQKQCYESSPFQQTCVHSPIVIMPREMDKEQQERESCNDYEEENCVPPAADMAQLVGPINKTNQPYAIESCDSDGSGYDVQCTTFVKKRMSTQAVAQELTDGKDNVEANNPMVHNDLDSTMPQSTVFGSSSAQSYSDVTSNTSISSSKKENTNVIHKRKSGEDASVKNSASNPSSEKQNRKSLRKSDNVLLKDVDSVMDKAKDTSVKSSTTNPSSKKQNRKSLRKSDNVLLKDLDSNVGKDASLKSSATKPSSKKQNRKSLRKSDNVLHKDVDSDMNKAKDTSVKSSTTNPSSKKQNRKSLRKSHKVLHKDVDSNVGKDTSVKSRTTKPSSKKQNRNTLNKSEQVLYKDADSEMDKDNVSSMKSPTTNPSSKKQNRNLSRKSYKVLHKDVDSEMDKDNVSSMKSPTTNPSSKKQNRNLSRKSYKVLHKDVDKDTSAMAENSVVLCSTDEDGESACGNSVTVVSFYSSHDEYDSDASGYAMNFRPPKLDAPENKEPTTCKRRLNMTSQQNVKQRRKTNKSSKITATKSCGLNTTYNVVPDESADVFLQDCSTKNKEVPRCGQKKKSREQQNLQTKNSKLHHDLIQSCNGANKTDQEDKRARKKRIHSSDSLSMTESVKKLKTGSCVYSFEVSSDEESLLDPVSDLERSPPKRRVPVNLTALALKSYDSLTKFDRAQSKYCIGE